MDINLITDPNQIPRPRQEIRIEEITANSLEDGKRIRIDVRTTPFAPADRPNIDINVADPSGNSAGSMAIVETMHNSLSLIFHLRADNPLQGIYQIEANLYYDESPIQSSAEVTITLP